MTTEKKKLLKKLTKRKYVDFFNDVNSVYMECDGITQPHYIGVALEFVSELDEIINSINILQLEYYYEHKQYCDEYMLKEVVGLFDNPKNYNKLLDSTFIDGLTADDVICVFDELMHINCHVDGFIEKCGEDGVISKLLAKLTKEIL